MLCGGYGVFRLGWVWFWIWRLSCLDIFDVFFLRWFVSLGVGVRILFI